MIKIIEDLETTDNKQQILDCVNDIESICLLLKELTFRVYDKNKYVE